MRTATNEEANAYHDKAKEWMANAIARSMFTDCKRVTLLSIAEYLANQDGLTLFLTEKL